MKNKNAGFVALAALAAILVAGIAYMFLFKPLMDSRQEALEETESVVDFNSTLEIKLAQYKKEYSLMPEYEEQIADIATHLTPQEDLPSVREKLESTFTRYNLTVKVENVQPATLMEPLQMMLGPAAAAAGRESYVDGLEFTDLYQTFYEVELEGTANDILMAVGDLQLQDGRFVLVQGVEIQDSGDAEQPDLYTGQLRFYVFTLVDPTAQLDPGGFTAAK